MTVAQISLVELDILGMNNFSFKPIPPLPPPQKKLKHSYFESLRSLDGEGKSLHRSCMKVVRTRKGRVRKTVGKQPV